MGEPRGGSMLARFLFGCMILVCGAAVLAGLVVAAGKDDNTGAWRGRTLGFVMSGVALAVGAAMIGFARRGQTHYWGMVGALTLAALLTGAYSYKTGVPRLGDRAEAIPLVIGDWAGSIHPVDDSTRRALGTDDIVMRSYRRPSTISGRGEPVEPRGPDDLVSLAVVLSMGARKVAHPPEQCYAADGFEMNDIALDSFTTKDGQTVRARRLHIIRGNDDQFVLYWYKAGDLNTPVFLEQQIHIILSNLLMRSETVALVRLSTQVKSINEKPDEAMGRLKDFARDLFPEIKARLK